MRYFFLLLLLIFLCTGARAQLTVTADLGLKDDYCSATVTDPNADCINVPTGNNMLTYLPGQDGEILITYRLVNNSGKRIVQFLFEDSEYGEVFPVTATNIPAGVTVPANFIYPARTTPTTVNATIKLTVEYANGTSEVVQNTYVIDVVPPTVSVEFGVALQSDVCDNTIAPNCPVPYGALNGQTVTVGALDTFTTRFAWTNDGLSTFDMESLVDQDNFQIASTGFDQTPGQTLISSRHWEAPAAPGTYNYSQTLTVTDFAGNTATATVTYIIIVQAPQVSVEFGVARQADVCDNQPLAAVCSVPYGALDGQTITVGALDTFTTRFAWTNEGLNEWDMENLVDQDNFQIANTGFNQEPGQTLISSRHWEAPAAPGTYNYSQTLTVTDLGGNTAMFTVTYLVIVQAPQVSVEFGVANQNDVCPDVTTAALCNVPYGALNGQLVTVGAGDTITTRFAWTNDGLGTWDMENLVDQDGNQLANTGFDQQPGQTLISSHHLIAPGIPDTYDWSQTLTITDKGGNTATATVTFRVKVTCSISDLAPPVALCRNRTFTIVEGDTQTINAGMLDDGSFDGCGALAGGAIDITSFTCADEGPNTVTLTVGDLQGNTASCTSTVTINVEEAIYEGPNNNCVTTSVAVTGGQTWWDIAAPNGRIIAQVLIGNNTNIASVKASIFKSGSTTENFNGLPFLSKRINLLLLNGSGMAVQPNNEPVYVRLYYTESEMDALMAAAGAANPNNFTVVKTSNNDCGSGYTGQNATGMNTTRASFGCAGEDAYFEFFTGSFSTFYLFAADAVLPVELTTFNAREVEKQKVRLDWVTASETDNLHFQVEHSTDGRTFSALGAVAGAGNSVTEQAYEYLHETPVVGVNYYRLRQVDIDGTETLSEVREVNLSGSPELAVFPNPTAAELRVKGFAGGPVKIINQQGQVVLQRYLGELEPLEVSHLPSGLYLLQLPAANLRWIKR